MLEKIIKSGDKIEIKKINALGKAAEDEKYYISMVMDILDDNRVGIAMPIERGTIVPLDVGERYSLVFYGTNGLYQCKGAVQERYKKDRFYIAVIKFISAPEKLQRRQFFRLNCLITINYRAIEEIPSDGKAVSFTSPMFTATTIDISGGGLRFNFPEYRPDDTKYQVSFNIAVNNELKPITTCARVVYVSDTMNKAGFYEYRLEFVGIAAKDRELIIRYVFDEERKRRQKDIK